MNKNIAIVKNSIFSEYQQDLKIAARSAKRICWDPAINPENATDFIHQTYPGFKSHVFNLISRYGPKIIDGLLDAFEDYHILTGYNKATGVLTLVTHNEVSINFRIGSHS